jgi:integrase
MPRRRKTNTHLPPNVRYTDYEKDRKKNKPGQHKGIYHYMTYVMENGKSKRKKIPLGHSYQEAMAKHAKLTDPESAPRSKLMNDVFDRYMKEVSAVKAPATHKDELRKVANLRSFFGQMMIGDIEPQTVYQYMDIRGQTAPVRANREKALLSHVFTKAIRWGLVTSNPCFRLEDFKETPRERYPKDWEFMAIRTWHKTPPILSVLMGFMYAAGRRRCELLPINIASDVDKKEGIKFYDPKAKEWLLLEWDICLRKLYEEALKIRKKVGSFYLFSNKFGKPYRSDTLCKMFRKVILGALKEGIIEEPFVLHDCRAKGGSDAKSLDEAFNLLNHSTPQITNRVYRRQLKRVKTIKRARVVLENAYSTGNEKAVNEG